MKEIVLEVFRLIDYDATICQHFEEAFEQVALATKKKRIVAAAERAAATPMFPGLSAPTVADTQAIVPGDLVLASGRPRSVNGESALVLAMCRAHLGSLSSKQAIERIHDSITMNAYFEDSGMPSGSTMHEWINCIPEECYEHVLDAHLLMIRAEGLDNLDAVTADSFSVWANTSWPTDSATILGLLSRAWHYASKLPRFGMATFTPAYIPTWLGRIRDFDRQISFACGKANSKRKIRRLYHRLCNRADLLMQRLDRQMAGLLLSWQAQLVSLPAFERQRAEAVLERVLSDLADAARVVAYARERVQEGRSTPTSEKVLSLSDPSAAYIKKGGREPVIGYKPQVMRSRYGFITAFELQTGNPNDAARLVPLVEQHLNRTDVELSVVSVDDGYSSRSNREVLAELGVDTISMNGATGKRITPTEEWESLLYKEARNKRSAVESLVFTLRFKFHLYRFSRRGIVAVGNEMYEKVIAHNLWRAAMLRKRAAAQESVAMLDAA